MYRNNLRMKGVQMEDKTKKDDVDVDDELLDDQDDTDTGDTDGDKDTKEEPKKKQAEKVFTQAQVNKMMATEKRQGRSSALKELGVNPKDTKMVNMVKALIASQKSDEQKQAEKEQEELSKVEEANQRALTAEAKAEAMTLGVKTQYVDDIVTLALAKISDDSDLKTIIGEFKTKYPIWFGKEDEEDNKSKAGQKGTGSSIKTGSKKDSKNEEKGLGARLAAKKTAQTKKTSYWGAR